jgi:hypothetical protein
MEFNKLRFEYQDTYYTIPFFERVAFILIIRTLQPRGKKTLRRFAATVFLRTAYG